MPTRAHGEMRIRGPTGGPLKGQTALERAFSWASERAYSDTKPPWKMRPNRDAKTPCKMRIRGLGRAYFDAKPHCKIRFRGPAGCPPKRENVLKNAFSWASGRAYPDTKPALENANSWVWRGAAQTRNRLGKCVFVGFRGAYSNTKPALEKANSSRSRPSRRPTTTQFPVRFRV